MICAKLYILLTLVISFSFAEDVYECPLQCDCSDDYSVVTCRDMEKFPVLDFAAKVKILFISHNPLDCDHVTTRTLKYTLRETMKLKAFDGHKIKCPQMVTIMKNPFMAPNPMPRPHYHYHDVSPDRCLTPGKIVAVVCLTMFGLAAFAILCWLLTSTSVTRMLMENSEDPVRDMEEGKAEGEKGPQVSDDLENDDYLRMKMEKHRRKSQGYAEGSPTSDEESEMTEIDLND
ncbi:hypothetical protein P5673_015880 [Acropora cervicornis]|uniref:Uncharacterized protein n=1 Tax=Acropora cervicornis TaxID=6130 RepID=A0AAD9QHK5_ACRCE|nr:hypothetical protein P5673_015880 [Acropora cervicornis]